MPRVVTCVVRKWKAATWFYATVGICLVGQNRNIHRHSDRSITAWICSDTMWLTHTHTHRESEAGGLLGPPFLMGQPGGAALPSPPATAVLGENQILDCDNRSPPEPHPFVLSAPELRPFASESHADRSGPPPCYHPVPFRSNCPSGLSYHTSTLSFPYESVALILRPCCCARSRRISGAGRTAS